MKKWKRLFFSVAVGSALALGGIAGTSHYANAVSTWQLLRDTTGDHVWTMPAEVKGTYCINDWGNPNGGGTTELGNNVDNVTLRYQIDCKDVCAGSTVDIRLSCGEVYAAGCNVKFYLVGDGNNGTITEYAESTNEDCSKPLSVLHMKFTKEVKGPKDLYLSTEENAIVTPTLCFNGNTCHKVYIDAENASLPSGGALACADTDKAEIAQFVEQFRFGVDYGYGVYTPTKSIIDTNGECPRCSFAGPSEGIFNVRQLGECCDSTFWKYNSVAPIKFCNNVDGENKEVLDKAGLGDHQGALDDPIHVDNNITPGVEKGYLNDITLTMTATNGFKGVEGITLNLGDKYNKGEPFSKNGNGYTLKLDHPNDILSDHNGCRISFVDIEVCSNKDNCSCTPLENGDFTLHVKYNFRQPKSNDYAVKGVENWTLQKKSFDILTHRWILNGWEGTTPYMNTGAADQGYAYDTFVKIFNDYVTPADVYVDIFPDKGDPIYNVYLGKVEAKQVFLMWAKYPGEKPAGVTDIVTAVKQQKGIDLAGSFAARFVVTVPAHFVHGVVVQKSLQGDRVMPINKAISAMDLFLGNVPQVQ